MAEKPLYKTVIVASLKQDGQWSVKITITDLPLSGRERSRLERVIALESKNVLREWTLKQRAQKRLDEEAKSALTKAPLTGNKA